MRDAGAEPLSRALVGLVAAFLLGAVVAVGLLLTKRAQRRSAIAFGPFLVLAVLELLVFGGFIREELVGTLLGT